MLLRLGSRWVPTASYLSANGKQAAAQDQVLCVLVLVGGQLCAVCDLK